MNIHELRRIIREELLNEVLMSPAMFRNVTLESPKESPAVKGALEKLSINFVRSAMNKESTSTKNHLDNRYVREGIGQLETGFKNALMNNLTRLYGKQHYNDVTRDLSDDFHMLVTNVSDTATEMLLSTINDGLKKHWKLGLTGDMNQLVSDLEEEIIDMLDNSWNVAHSQFVRSYDAKFKDIDSNAA